VHSQGAKVQDDTANGLTAVDGGNILVRMAAYTTRLIFVIAQDSFEIVEAQLISLSAA
jgi:hypothetical protein